MPFAELDELYGLVTKEDQAILDQVLVRNEAARLKLAGDAELSRVFLSGDEAAVTAAIDKRKPATTVINSGGGTGVTTDIAALEAKWNADFDKKFGASLSNKAFEEAVTAAANKVIESRIPAFESDLLGKAAATSDSVYQIRRSHEKEFGKELDTAKFTEFLDGNKGKFASLTAAHDAYVQDERIEARIATGVAKELETRDLAQLPGSTLPQQQTVMAGMVRRNAELTQPAGTAAANRGPSLDAAARAFRLLRTAGAA